MSKKSLKNMLDTDNVKPKKTGRPFGTTRAPAASTAQNVPFTELENEKLEELIKLRGHNKRHWIKKFIWEGLQKELEMSR